MKSRRQAVILELVDREALHSQEVLRRRLHHHGFEATQATISRDIKELGLVKRAGDGAYQRPGTETANPSNVTMFAIQRIAFSLCLFTSSRISAPASGVNRMMDR